MSPVEIHVLEKVELNNPIFIEALPGIGHVGKLAADHIIDEFEAIKFAEIYSNSYPPQVFVKEEGIIQEMVNELYYIKDVGEDNNDLILHVGNAQPLSPEGQYEFCRDVLSFVKDFNIKQIYTLGGLPIGQNIEENKVFGAATSKEIIDFLKENDVEIRSNDGGIVGASGILLGIGKLFGIEGACLMGETPGYFIDASAAEAILLKLASFLKFEINIEKLEEKAEETKQMLDKAQQLEQDILNRSAGDVDDLSYIG